MILDQFKFLTTAELSILEQHLKLGITHLKKHLSDKQLKLLLGSISLNPSQMSKMGNTSIEISGNLSLVLNSIFSAIFGAWMGYSAFWGLNLHSLGIFGCIVALAASIGIFIGYQKIQFTKQQAREAINNQKLKLFQLEILKEIDQKKREEVDTILCQLDSLFVDLGLNTFFREGIHSKNEISEWIEKLEILGQEKLEKRFSGVDLAEWIKEWREIYVELRHNLLSFFCEQQGLDAIHTESQEFLEPTLKKLISTFPKKAADSPHWSSKNMRSLVVELTPTLLGGFSSLLVYLKGVPTILKNFGHTHAFLFFTNSKVKAVEFAASLMLTLYFGFSFVYKQRNRIKRDQELEGTDQQIIQMEASLTGVWTNFTR